MRATTGTRAIIVGGGIGGLTAAIALRRVGIEATVYERLTDIRVGSGLTVWSNAMKALQRLGLSDAVWARATALEWLETRTWRGNVLAAVPMGQLGKKLGSPSAGVQRAALLDVLLNVLEPDVVQRGTTFVDYEQDADAVNVRFANGRSESADLLIGADGINSATRAQTIGNTPPRPAGYVGWGSDTQFELTQFRPGTFVMSHGPGSSFGLIPAGPGTVAWFGTVRMAAGQPDPAGGRKARLLERFRSWHQPIADVLEASDESRIFRMDINDREPVDRWGEGRVTLLGDAAHPLIPTLGQGACLAIEDAVVLARCLSLGGDVSAALRLYEKERMARTAKVQQQAWFLGKIFHRQTAWGAVLRDAFLRLQTTPPGMRLAEQVAAYEA